MRLFVVGNRVVSSTGGANTLCEVIWCSGAGVTDRSRSRASHTLGVKTMNNGAGKMTNRTQTYRGSSGKNDRLTAKRTTFGSVGDHLVQAGLAKLVRDVVRCVKGDKCVGVLEANEALLKAEMELKDGIRGGHASAAQKIRRGVHFSRLTFFKR